jgi:hypothetical protein
MQIRSPKLFGSTARLSLSLFAMIFFPTVGCLVIAFMRGGGILIASFGVVWLTVVLVIWFAGTRS